MTRILITDHVFPGLDIEREVLAQLGAEIVLAPSSDEDTLVEQASRVDGILVCFASVSERVVDAAAAGGCRIIARYGIGYDNVAVDAASRHGIVVTNVPDYCLDEVADHTMALLLAAARGVVPATREVGAGGWSIGHEGIHRLAGRQIALVGLGGIGQRVAVRAQAFGLKVVGVDPFVQSRGVPGVELVGNLEDALEESNFVSLHLPATAENRHLIDQQRIGCMKASPVLINTSRGSLVDLNAVLQALDNGSLAGVALDVTDPEPLPPDHPLRTHPRAIITPHMAFHSVEATDELQRRTAEEVLRVLTGQRPERPVNRAALAE
jgi:D-3-phosphoglycerate dehydrogenase / 2-oxoglutarate reductase